NDAKIIFGYMRELWAAGAFTNGPDVRRTRLEPLIHANVTTIIQLNPGLLKTDSIGIRDTSSGDQDIAAIDVLLTRRRADDKFNILSRLPTYREELSFQENLNAFVAKSAPHFLENVDILPPHKLRAGLDDCHVAAKATVSLRHFEANIPPADHD